MPPADHLGSSDREIVPDAMSKIGRLLTALCFFCHELDHNHAEGLLDTQFENPPDSRFSLSDLQSNCKIIKFFLEP